MLGNPLRFFFWAKYLLEMGHFRAIFGPFSGSRACFESCASPMLAACFLVSSESNRGVFPGRRARARVF